MKKIILPILMMICTASFAQVCVPNAVTNSNKGYIIPDAATNFNDACIGQNYTQYIYIKVPKDTSVVYLGLTIPATIDSFVIKKDIIGLPPGLMAETVPNFRPAAPSNPKTNFERLVVKGDSLACIKISGVVPTGTPLGINNLSINVRVYLNLGLTAIDTAMDLNYYTINVKANNCYPASASNIEKYNFDLVGNIPNPANGNTNIVFESAKADNFDLKIIDALGGTIFNQTIKSQIGMNYITLDASKFSTGMYMILLSDSKNRLTQKMQVK